MNVRRLTVRTLLLLLALVIYSGAILPQQEHTEAPKNAELPRFGQSIALSDFDTDGLVDEATLEGSSLAILLSGPGDRPCLHFNSDRVILASLLTRDIENDDAIDLIWTDPFRKGGLFVGLVDQGGRFQDVSSDDHHRGRALKNTNVAEPEISNLETAIDFETDQPLDQTLSPKYLDCSAGELPNYYADRFATSSPALGRPTGRAPPFLLS